SLAAPAAIEKGATARDVDGTEDRGPRTEDRGPRTEGVRLPWSLVFRRSSARAVVRGVLAPALRRQPLLRARTRAEAIGRQRAQVHGGPAGHDPLGQQRADRGRDRQPADA